MTDSKITSSIIYVTPVTAQRWLELNRNNRIPRDSRVAKYREDMECGRWLFAGDPIRFDTAGNLIDGQHRLLALAEAQIEGITFFVIRGLPTSAQGVMDQGAKRTPGDQLSMAGVKNASNVASSVKQYLIWERGLLFRDAKLSHDISTPAIEQWVRENPSRVDRLNASMQHVRRSGANISVAGAAFLRFEQVDPEAAAEFFHLLATGAGFEGDPINTLSQKLTRQRTNKIKVVARDQLAMFVQAWNAWREDRLLKHLVRPKSGRWSVENFPEPR